jgi:hypothetical protein
MTNSGKTHALNSETGIVTEVPEAWLDLFPSLVETDPEDDCVACAMDIPEELEEESEQPKTTSKGSKK